MILKVTVGELQTNCYIFSDDESKEAMIVDPGDEGERISYELDKYGLIPTIIVNTHCHFDHVGANAFLKGRYDIPLAIGEYDKDCLKSSHIYAFTFIGKKQPPSPEADIVLKESDKVKVGRYVFTVLHTPGHSEGSICLYQPEEEILFSGDTLFFESVGRWDIPGGNEFKLMSSLKRILSLLPPTAVVYPGHGEKTTIGYERENNPFLERIK